MYYIPRRESLLVAHVTTLSYLTIMIRRLILLHVNIGDVPRVERENQQDISSVLM